MFEEKQKKTKLLCYCMDDSICNEMKLLLSFNYYLNDLCQLAGKCAHF